MKNYFISSAIGLGALTFLTSIPLTAKEKEKNVQTDLHDHAKHDHHDDAAKSKKSAVRKHHAHVHGSATMGIAVEKEGASSFEVKVEFESPAQAIYGFEHEAKSQEDKNKQSNALKTLKDNLNLIVAVPAEFDCKVVKSEAEVEKSHAHKGEKEVHADVEAELELLCGKDPSGAKVEIDVMKYFPAVESLKVTVLSAKKQEPVVLKPAKGTVTL